MTIRLNVKISVSDQGKSVMVWSDEMKDLSGIEEYTGIGLDIPGAVSDYFDSLPETIFIEDDIVLKTADFNYDLIKPYEVEHCDQFITF